MRSASLVALEQVLNRYATSPSPSIGNVSTSASDPHECRSTRRINNLVVGQQVINPRYPLTLLGQALVRLQVIGNLAAYTAGIISDSLVQFHPALGVEDAKCHCGFLPCSEYTRLRSET